MIFIGDSDISRWPPHLYPTDERVTQLGRGGAVISDLLQQIDEWKALPGVDCSSHADGNAAARTLFVGCAGENDLGSGRSLDQILDTFRSVLDSLFKAGNQDQMRLVFLGPKYEPWLTDDNVSRKQYAKLNNGLQRAIRKHHACDEIIYIDCLTMFCTEETASVPGAVYGGKSIPDTTYFDDDGLHLNESGYAVWKKIVEAKIAEL